MPKPLLDLDATPERLRALADAGVLTPTALERALHLSVATPPRADWRRFLSTTLMGLGALLVLAGVIYFFAYNWAEMHRFAKLGLIAAAIIGTAVAAWRLGETLGGQLSLLAGSVLVGALLAVYGQAYQTGADPYELFLGWAVLILPWVAVSRFPPLGLLALVLVNTGIMLFWDQVLETKQDQTLWLAVVLGGLNGFTWATYEHFANLRVSWLQARWPARVLAVMAVAPVLIGAVPCVMEPSRAPAGALVSLLLVLASLAAEYALHRHLRGELFMLTLAAVSVMTLLTSAALSRIVDSEDVEVLGVFVLPLFVIAQVALAVWWLRHEARATGATEES
ncbi:DUF2157 domain-containing protein [Corallococcus macrosporus]|uniref:DUF2157 domain-containing protein n=1 Tax=Corallococcus macrosporus DSM 14697 TaxID=1189310 RepID=A0A250K135_9BACT|nr:DUF2157 domain-containing protein [Corallococcus macrosporus]ATB49814.1 hypothetical protein MYMAC_005468 [Corallococcus macrosporus DSM 14697]